MFLCKVYRPIVGIFCLLLLSGCGAESIETEENRPRVISTVGFITDILRNVGEPDIHVIGLMGEGVDPHSYSPTRRDVIHLQNADLIFYNGFHLEGRMIDVLRRMQQRGKSVVGVSERIVERGFETERAGEEVFDPHLWGDVRAWMLAVDVVTEALIEAFPDGTEAFLARASNYRNELEALDQEIRGLLATLPEERRVLITAHDAFGYFGRAYSLEVRAIQGISTESEAGLRDIEDLVQFIVERDVPAVFLETTVSDRSVRALIEGARARGHDLKIGGILYSDAMGPPGTEAGTYIGMMRHNARTIVAALREE